jgi:hypothetical protein
MAPDRTPHIRAIVHRHFGFPLNLRWVRRLRVGEDLHSSVDLFHTLAGIRMSILEDTKTTLPP